MIDRASRDRLALALRHYCAGLITNFCLENVEVEFDDPGVVAIEDMSWLIYSDNREHYANEDHFQNRQTRHEVARWILFLMTDLEYRWPKFRAVGLMPCGLFSLLTFGWLERRRVKKWQSFATAGDYAVWPFFSRAEYKAALREPRLLSGAERSGAAAPL